MQIKKSNFLVITLVLFAILFVSVFFGVVSAVMPWYIPTGLVLGTVYLLLLWQKPWIGLYLYVLIVMFAPDFKIADVTTIISLVIYWLKGISVNSAPFWIDKKLLFPYLWFIFFVLLSCLLGFFYFHNDIPYMYRDGRAFLYWLWFPLIGGMVASTPNGLKYLGFVVLAIGISVAVIALFQAVTGMQIVAIGKVGGLETEGANQSDFVRVQMPGFTFVVWGILWLFISIAQKTVNKLTAMLLALLFIGALLVNFGRGLWIWTLVALLVSMCLIEKRRALSLLSVLVVMGFVFTSLFLVIKPEIIDAIVIRFTSVKNEGGGLTSYGLRQWENESALSKLYSHFILGVGMGGEYRNWINIPNIAIFKEHTRYIHNSYLFLWLKTGIFGLTSLLWLLIVAWFGGFITKKKVHLHESHTYILVSIAALPSLLALSVTQPDLVSAYSIMLFIFILLFLNPPSPEIGL